MAHGDFGQVFQAWENDLWLKYDYVGMHSLYNFRYINISNLPTVFGWFMTSSIFTSVGLSSLLTTYAVNAVHWRTGYILVMLIFCNYWRFPSIIEPKGVNDRGMLCQFNSWTTNRHNFLADFSLNTTEAVKSWPPSYVRKLGLMESFRYD